ncbi:hypothetical protein Q5P01_002986 [Channa striata]|uniref:Ig-like domain-containing protein n=1 Tax=Channa striata TaxID=64152 RepID=A0AA88P272_CHASR|nr:hypothetical protein Q5P01_002986 [Channa striata]
MAVLSCSLLWMCLPVCFLSVSEQEQEVLTAEPGQTVSLTCRAPSNIDISAVEWTRPDLKPEYVFFYRDAQSDPENQHPSFVNRVELKDKQMKDRDVSLLLKDLTVNDTGTYECRVLPRRTGRTQRSMLDTEPIKTINVKVQQSRQCDAGFRQLVSGS